MIPFEATIALILFVYGTVIGSFLNVVIYRTPKKEQVVSGRSRCMSCGHTLAWYDLFPVLSWVSLRGKCRYCKTKVSGRYALVEMLCGVSFATAFLALGFSIPLAFAVVLFPVLICASFLDIDTGEIEYWCPITIAVLGLTALGLSFAGVLETAWSAHLLGTVVVSVPFAILAFFGAMGGADVQLMAAAGLLLGWNIVPAAFIGIFSGAIVGVVMKLRGKSDTDASEAQAPTPETQIVSEDDGLPAMKGTVLRFGPFLALGIAASFLYGERLIDFYLRFMGFR
jgi:leader peptidase (prepilin peptidase)/N-methyltransferase